MSSGKFFPLDSLKRIIEEHKKNHKTIALANGGFDLLHVGHIRYLQAASRIADILVVAVNTDESLRNLKGDGRPIIGQEGRLKMLSAIEHIDYLTLFDQPRVDEVLLALKPDFHCKGSDYTSDTVPEKDVVKSYGGRIAIVGGEKVRSSSVIMKELKSE